MLPPLDRLQSSARSLADLLARSAQELHDGGAFADPQLTARVLEYRQLDSACRQLLVDAVSQTQLQCPLDLSRAPLTDLQHVSHAVQTVKQAREQLIETRFQLQQLPLTAPQLQEWQRELDALESQLQRPEFPPHDSLVAWASRTHPLPHLIEQALHSPAMSTPASPSAEQPATSAEVETDATAPASDTTDEPETAAIFTEPDPLNDPAYLFFTEDLMPASEDSETRADLQQQLQRAINPSVPDLAPDLIFDDIAPPQTDKQILTSAELLQRIDQLHHETAANQARSASADTDTETNTETDIHNDGDLIFAELESAQQSADTTTPHTTATDTDKSTPAPPPSATPEPSANRTTGTQTDTPTEQLADLPEEFRSFYVESLPLADYTQIQELAAKADDAQNRFDRVSYLARLIWELVAQGEYSWAYQVSLCLFGNVDKDLTIPAPPPWLLQLLTLGDQVKFSSGRVAREFQSVASLHRKQATQIAEHPDTAEAYLLRAALMRGAITTASSVSSDILRTFVIQPNQTQLYNYCSRIASFSTRATGVKLDQYFYRPGAASVETEAKAIRSLVTSWKNAVFEKILSYQLTTPLFARAHWSVQATAAVTQPELQQYWRTRQVLQSHIARLLQPIQENRLAPNSQMEAELRRLSQAVILDGENTQVILSAREIVTLPGRSLYNYVQQAIEYGSHWLVLASAYPGVESVLVPQEINELRDEIDRRQQTVFRELQQIEKTHNSHAHRAALTACRRNMDRIHQLFHPTEEIRLGELDPGCLLNAELLKIPGVSLDEDWSCHTPATSLEHQILHTLQQGPISWEQAFQQQLSSGAYRSARALLRMDVWTETQRDELRAELEIRRQDNASTLQELAQRVKDQVAESRQVEILSPREADRYLEHISTLESRMPGEYRLDQIRQELMQIRQTLDSRRAQVLKKMQERMSLLSGFEAPPPSGSPPPPELPPPTEKENDADDWALDV